VYYKNYKEETIINKLNNEKDFTFEDKKNIHFALFLESSQEHKFLFEINYDLNIKYK
jgi:hypothetical protein